MKFKIQVFILFLFAECACANPCPPEAKCEAVPDEEIAYMAATMVAAKNICSRIDSANAENYALAIDLMVVNEKAAYEKALQLKEFPTSLKYVEEEFNSLPLEKVKNQCSELLEKLK
jgi:hypothetical protein